MRQGAHQKEKTEAVVTGSKNIAKQIKKRAAQRAEDSMFEEFQDNLRFGNGTLGAAVHQFSSLPTWKKYAAYVAIGATAYSCGYYFPFPGGSAG